MNTLDVTLISGQIPVDGDSCGSLSIELGLASIGPRGLSDKMYFIRIADGPIGGHRAVIGNLDGTVSYADTEDVLHLGKVLGITTSSAEDGEEVEIIRSGIIEFNGWSWDVETPVFLSTNGLLSQTPSVVGFSQIVGFAESPTKLFVNLREPLLLT